MRTLLGRLLARLCGHTAAPQGRADVGRRGERAAARYLKQQGYRVLERNYSARGGEIDLVVFRDGVVAFVEVRSLSAGSQHDPAASVTRPKQRRVLRAAHEYCARRGLDRRDVALRFDVVAVRFGGDGRPAELRHIPNAFAATPRGF